MGATILVVEDDPQVRDLVRITLECAGYRVEAACDVAEALDSLERGLPDLIVLDLMLPEVSGIQFAEQLRESALQPRVPILVLSAAPQLVYKAGWICADACLGKPFAVEALLDHVARLTGWMPVGRALPVHLAGTPA
jgi:two-component system, OmpR family, phosphate regulon response regulator PhoB